MRNFPGAYHLLAGDNFGQWLTVDGQMHDQTGVKGYLQSQGGNGVLFEDARKTHAEGIDGWLDYDGRIDVRAVVGVGLLTTHKVDVTTDAEEGDADVEVDAGRRRHHRAAVLGPPADAGRPADGRPDPHPGALRHPAHGPDSRTRWSSSPTRSTCSSAARRASCPSPSATCRATSSSSPRTCQIPPPVLDEGFAAAADGPLTLGQAAVGGQGRRDRPAGRHEGRRPTTPRRWR